MSREKIKKQDFFDHMTCCVEQKKGTAKCSIQIVLLFQGNHWKPLETIGNHWKPLETTVNHWKPLETIGNHYKPLETIGNPWKPLETTGNHYKPL